MNTVLEKITEQALALPPDARAELADRLVESLNQVRDNEIEALWIDEAVRRRDEIRSGAVKPVSREDARKRVGGIVS